MFTKETHIPFDVAPYRALPFSLSDFTDIEAAKFELRKIVAETQKEGFQADNPVTRARGFQKISANATPEAKFLLDETTALDQRVRAIEQKLSGGAVVPETNLWSMLRKIDLPHTNAYLDVGIKAVVKFRSSLNEETAESLAKAVLTTHSEYVAASSFAHNKLTLAYKGLGSADIVQRLRSLLALEEVEYVEVDRQRLQ
jgi:hypothetical protein